MSPTIKFILGEAFSAPGLGAAALLLLYIILTATLRSRACPKPAEPTAEKSPHVEAADKKIERKKGSRKVSGGLIISALILFIYWSGARGFNVGVDIIILLIVWSGAAYFLRYRSILKSGGWRGPVALLLTAGFAACFMFNLQFLHQIIGAAIGLGVLIFLLYLFLVITYDFILQRLLGLWLRFDYYPGRMVIPSLAAMVLLLNIGPERRWVLSPAGFIEIGYQRFLLAAALFLGMFLCLFLARRFDIGYAAFWRIVRAAFATEVLMIIAAVSSLLIVRFDLAECSQVDSEPRASRLPGYYHISDAQVSGGWLIFTEKEQNEIHRISLADGARETIHLKFMPERIEIDHDSGMIFLITADVKDAPVTVVGLDPFKKLGSLSPSGCGKSYWTVLDREHHRLALFCGGRVDNIFIIDTENPRILPLEIETPITERFFHGAFLKGKHQLYTVSLYWGGGYQYRWEHGETERLGEAKALPQVISMVQDAAVVEPHRLLLVSRNNGLMFNPLGRVDAYHLDDFSPAWSFGLHSSRYLAYEPQADRIYGASLAEGTMYIIDPADGRQTGAVFIGKQIRSITSLADSSILVGTKCGVVVYRPETVGDDSGNPGARLLRLFAELGGKKSSK